MGVWVHRLREKNIEKLTANCQKCGLIEIIKDRGTWKCWNSKKFQSSRENRKDERPHRHLFRRSLKLDIYKCESCGLENNDFRFFDVHHKNSNHKDNRLENLQLLCPNCHRLETINLWKSLKKYNG